MPRPNASAGTAGRCGGGVCCQALLRHQSRLNLGGNITVDQAIGGRPYHPFCCVLHVPVCGVGVWLGAGEGAGGGGGGV